MTRSFNQRGRRSRDRWLSFRLYALSSSLLPQSASFLCFGAHTLRQGFNQ